MEEVPGSEKFFPAQLVFLALGFLGPESAVVKSLGVKQDARSNIQTPSKACNQVIYFCTCAEAFYSATLRMSMVSLPQEIVAAGNRLLYGASSEYTQFGNGKISKIYCQRGTRGSCRSRFMACRLYQIAIGRWHQTPGMWRQTLIFGTKRELTLLN